jgi:rhamnogalacturonyl hydrolase YesR
LESLEPLIGEPWHFDGGPIYDQYADAIEGALNLYNRERVLGAERWIDHSIKEMWAIQREDGFIDHGHPEGNFARTSLMYSLWKTKGVTAHEWNPGLRLGAVTLGNDQLLLALESEGADWKGELRFDRPRHRDFFHLPIDWPRINQFPEWYTVEKTQQYKVTNATTQVSKVVTGEELIAGYPVEVSSSESLELIVEPFYEDLSDALTPKAIAEVTNRVADWQLTNEPEWWEKNDQKDNWVFGAQYAGHLRWAEISDQDKYFDALKRTFDGLDWRLGSRERHADDWCVGHAYTSFYLRDEQEGMVAPMKAQFDEVMKYPYGEDLDWKNNVHNREWAWADALFMGPQPLARLTTITGDMKYLEFGNRLWWKSYDFLYDKEEHLFYRDSTYFDKREANGEGLFWSRGNGWAYAGLARLLEEVPEDFADRPRYERLFVEMSEALVKTQHDNGFYPAGLLDGEAWNKPESSGTAFFTYGYAWGINHGLLERDAYMPAIEKGWGALVRSVEPNGKLTHVQPIGASPSDFEAESTMPYGAGGLMLAGAELYKLTLTQGAPSGSFTDRNPTKENRLNQRVILKWSDVTAKVSGLTAANILVIDDLTGSILSAQVLDSNQDGAPGEVTFKAHFLPEQTKSFSVYALE